jgi:hypothetical protein
MTLYTPPSVLRPPIDLDVVDVERPTGGERFPRPAVGPAVTVHERGDDSAHRPIGDEERTAILLGELVVVVENHAAG